MTVIHLPDDLEKQLGKAAVELHVPVADLAVVVVRDLLARPESEFDAAAWGVLDRNAELYRRLA